MPCYKELSPVCQVRVLSLSLWSGVGSVRSSPGRRLGAGMRRTDMALTRWESTAFRLRASSPEMRICELKQLARLEVVESLSSRVGTGVDGRREELLVCAWKHRGAVPPHPTPWCAGAPVLVSRAWACVLRGKRGPGCQSVR